MDQYQPRHESDETGHQHTRKEIIDKSKITASGILPKNFFQRSWQHIHDSPDYKNARTKESKEKVLEEKGNVIGVIGQAGVGKSTLMKDLLYRNVTVERLYKADFVFYVKLRDFSDKTKINLFQFLIENTVYNSLCWMKDSVIRKGLLKLLSKSESVCILLDGFDEAGIDATYLEEQTIIEFDINGQNFPQNFILGLLSGHILPKAKTIITSRPGQMLYLPEKYQPKFIVKIFGIKQQDIKQICLDICGDEYASQVLSRIESQSDLLSYCLVPINCVLIVNCIFCFIEEKEQKFSPNNITDVFVLTFFFFSKIENKRNKSITFDIKSFTDLKKISKLAWTGIKNQKLYFDEVDLKAVGLNETDISSFTVAFKQNNKENRVTVLENATKRCIYFSHLLLQEFFAAFFCLFFMDFSEFEATFFDSKIIFLTENRLEMISKFMFGLFNCKTFEIMKKIYPKISKPYQHMKRLTDFATTIAATIFNRRSLDNFLDILRICCWAYEIQDPEFCEKLAENFPEILYLYFDDDLLASDILSLCYVIKKRKKILKLWINMGILTDRPDFVKKLLHLFCKEMEYILGNLSHIKVIYFYKKLFPNYIFGAFVFFF